MWRGWGNLDQDKVSRCNGVYMKPGSRSRVCIQPRTHKRMSHYLEEIGNRWDPGETKATLHLHQAASYSLPVSAATNPSDCPTLSFQFKHMIG